MFARNWSDGWLFPPRELIEVVCRNDFAPYNLVYVGRRVTGLLDYETAASSPRAWDLAYALYRFAPFTTSPETVSTVPLGDPPHRAWILLDAYGSTIAQSRAAWANMAPRLRALTDFMQTRADAGDARYVDHVSAGHLDLYRADIRFRQSNQKAWQEPPDANGH